MVNLHCLPFVRAWTALRAVLLSPLGKYHVLGFQREETCEELTGDRVERPSA
jgi:hypothetical protein